MSLDLFNLTLGPILATSRPIFHKGKTKIEPNLRFWFFITNYLKWWPTKEAGQAGTSRDKPGQTSFGWDKPVIWVMRCRAYTRGGIYNFIVMDGNEAWRDLVLTSSPSAFLRKSCCSYANSYFSSINSIRKQTTKEVCIKTWSTSVSLSLEG